VESELLRRMLELLSERDLDWDAIFELVGPNVVWEVRSDFPDAGIYTGYEGMRRLSAAFDDVVEGPGACLLNTSTSGVTWSCRFAGADWA
jgi:hypothetical protein